MRDYYRLNREDQRPLYEVVEGANQYFLINRLDKSVLECKEDATDFCVALHKKHKINPRNVVFLYSTRRIQRSMVA